MRAAGWRWQGQERQSRAAASVGCGLRLWLHARIFTTPRVVYCMQLHIEGSRRSGGSNRHCTRDRLSASSAAGRIAAKKFLGSAFACSSHFSTPHAHTHQHHQRIHCSGHNSLIVCRRPSCHLTPCVVRTSAARPAPLSDARSISDRSSCSCIRIRSVVIAHASDEGWGVDAISAACVATHSECGEWTAIASPSLAAACLAAAVIILSVAHDADRSTARPFVCCVASLIAPPLPLPLTRPVAMSLDGRIGSAPSSHLISSPNAGASATASAGPAPLHSSSQSLETLDEPVSDTILRDLRRVAIKLKHVLVPKDTVKELRDCTNHGRRQTRARVCVLAGGLADWRGARGFANQHASICHASGRTVSDPTRSVLFVCSL